MLRKIYYEFAQLGDTKETANIMFPLPQEQYAVGKAITVSTGEITPNPTWDLG